MLTEIRCLNVMILEDIVTMLRSVTKDIVKTGTVTSVKYVNSTNKGKLLSN